MPDRRQRQASSPPARGCRSSRSRRRLSAARAHEHSSFWPGSSTAPCHRPAGEGVWALGRGRRSREEGTRRSVSSSTISSSNSSANARGTLSQGSAGSSGPGDRLGPRRPMNRTEPGASLRRRRVWMWLVAEPSEPSRPDGATAAVAQDPVELKGEAILEHPVGQPGDPGRGAHERRQDRPGGGSSARRRTSRNGRSLRPMRRRTRPRSGKSGPPGGVSRRHPQGRSPHHRGPDGETGRSLRQGQGGHRGLRARGGDLAPFLGPDGHGRFQRPRQRDPHPGGRHPRAPDRRPGPPVLRPPPRRKNGRGHAAATTESQAKWKAEPASERAEIAAYCKKTVPKRAAMTAAIQSGGILIIEDDARASLNLVQSEQRSTTPGVVRSTSTTTAIPFAMEDGRWRLAQ